MRVVADRFHVAKLYREGVDDLRKKELRRLKHSLSTSAYQKLKGAMWALRKKDADLNDEDRQVLEQLFTHSPLLKQAHRLRDQLTEIFDQKITQTQAKHLLTRWMSRVKLSQVHCFDRFMKTLIARKDEITNYFLERHNSGFVEGLNNKIKVIKRRSYGILNTENLFQRLYLDTSGYALYA